MSTETTPTKTANASDAIVRAIRTAGSPVCVGLDPVLEKIPAQVDGATGWERVESFSRGVIESVRGIAPALKFQSACYERYGWEGVRVLERSMRLARELGFVVVLDAKRGDIGISASHYAAAARHQGAHFVTVNGYLGVSGIEPFLNEGLGVFVLVRTSNPDSGAFQSARTDGGATVAELMASSVRTLGSTRVGISGLSAVGAVVGATQSAEAAALRRIMPDQIFLIPGFGAQGGTAEDVRAMLRPDKQPHEAGVLVTASRSVLYPKTQATDWRAAVREAAGEFAQQVRTSLTGA
ncbi:MAG: orotidine-5'-phosphate decarboxylase [Planctomycetes bacterium]|nr:orotidine-5'-phosphate decarboxylase [Planctomycetota bacterium]